MRDRTRWSPESRPDRPASSAGTAVELRPDDIRRLPEYLLIAELAYLEERIRLLDPDDAGQDGRPTMQNLVDAEYTIMRELRRRQSVTQRGILWNTLRPRRVRSR